MTGKSLRFSELPKEYRALCGHYLPRPIHDKVGYENALEMVEAMAGFEERFSRDQGDYFVLITDLISAYEEENKDRSPEKHLTLRQRCSIFWNRPSGALPTWAAFWALTPRWGTRSFARSESSRPTISASSAGIFR